MNIFIKVFTTSLIVVMCGIAFTANAQKKTKVVILEDIFNQKPQQEIQPQPKIQPQQNAGPLEQGTVTAYFMSANGQLVAVGGRFTVNGFVSTGASNFWDSKTQQWRSREVSTKDLSFCGFYNFSSVWTPSSDIRYNGSFPYLYDKYQNKGPLQNGRVIIL